MITLPPLSDQLERLLVIGEPARDSWAALPHRLRSEVEEDDDLFGDDDASELDDDELDVDDDDEELDEDDFDSELDV